MNMGLYMKQNEGRSELQQRLDAELRAKAAARKAEEEKPVDGVEDSRFIEGTKQTTPLAFAWLAIFILVIVVFGLFIYKLSH